jgi:hypothetical protein
MVCLFPKTMKSPAGRFFNYGAWQDFLKPPAAAAGQVARRGVIVCVPAYLVCFGLLVLAMMLLDAPDFNGQAFWRSGFWRSPRQQTIAPGVARVKRRPEAPSETQETVEAS